VSTADSPSETNWVPLYERCPEDQPLNSEFRKKRGRHTTWRMRGFLFLVDWERRWEPRPDSESLLRIGRWLAGYEHYFTGRYSTDRRGGFVIRFSHCRDALMFQMQCLEQRRVFTEDTDPLMNISRPTLGRTETSQLPSAAPRNLSRGFTQKQQGELFMFRWYKHDPRIGRFVNLNGREKR
jgi:hypothetical protein